MDWETLYCPNRFCRYYGRSFHASRLVKNGSTRGQKQARCRSCGRTVALTYGTAYFDLDAEQFLCIQQSQHIGNIFHFRNDHLVTGFKIEPIKSNVPGGAGVD